MSYGQEPNIKNTPYGQEKQFKTAPVFTAAAKECALNDTSKQITESFSWLEGIDSFKKQDAGKSTIRIKGVAAKVKEANKPENVKKRLEAQLEKEVLKEEIDLLKEKRRERIFRGGKT